MNQQDWEIQTLSSEHNYGVFSCKKIDNIKKREQLNRVRKLVSFTRQMNTRVLFAFTPLNFEMDYYLILALNQ